MPSFSNSQVEYRDAATGEKRGGQTIPGLNPAILQEDGAL